jgi:predicted HAD superfamily phosphohydrolase YqeG
MSKQIKYARVMVGDKILDQVLGESLSGRPKTFTHPLSSSKKPDYETIKKIRWETSEDGNHTDLVIETDYSITSYNERYVICWGIY